MMMQPNSAPGQEQAPAQPTEGAPGDGAPPQGGPPSGGGGPFGGMMLLIPFLLLIGLMFFMNRNERKKRSQLESKLKKGDRVLTRAGIIGKLVELTDRSVKVEIAPGVCVHMLKGAIEGLDVDPNAPQPAAGKSEPAKGDKAKDDAAKDDKDADKATEGAKAKK